VLWSPFLSDTFGKLEEILATSTSDWGGNSLIIEKGYVRRTCMRGGGLTFSLFLMAVWRTAQQTQKLIARNVPDDIALDAAVAMLCYCASRVRAGALVWW